MKTIRDTVQGDVVLIEDAYLYGIIAGSVLVSVGVLFRSHGIVSGDLILEKDSTVYVHGTVNGDVINKGGHLEIFGIVNGKVLLQGGDSIIDSQAIVNGPVVQQTEGSFS